MSTTAQRVLSRLFARTLPLPLLGFLLTGPALAGEWKQVRSERLPSFEKLSSGSILTGYGANASVAASGFDLSGAAGAQCKSFNLFSHVNTYGVLVATAGITLNAWVHVGEGTGEVELFPYLEINGSAEIERGEGSASVAGFMEYRYKVDSFADVVLLANLTPLLVTTSPLGVGSLSAPQASLYVSIAIGGGKAKGKAVDFTFADHYPATYFREIGRSQGSVAALAYQTPTGPPNSFAFSELHGWTIASKDLISHPW
jgi:hypothetical protein